MVYVQSVVFPSPDSISAGITFYLVTVLTKFKPAHYLVPVLNKNIIFSLI